MIAPWAFGGIISSLGFATLGVLWFTFTWLGQLDIWRGDSVRHGRWMRRRYALTAAAITLRIGLLAALVGWVQFETIYRFMAWGSWMINLAAVEIVMTRLRKKEAH